MSKRWELLLQLQELPRCRVQVSGLLHQMFLTGRIVLIFLEKIKIKLMKNNENEGGKTAQ